MGAFFLYLSILAELLRQLEHSPENTKKVLCPLVKRTS